MALFTTAPRYKTYPHVATNPHTELTIQYTGDQPPMVLEFNDPYAAERLYRQLSVSPAVRHMEFYHFFCDNCPPCLYCGEKLDPMCFALNEADGVRSPAGALGFGHNECHRLAVREASE
jgi:hypothetical protein